MNPKKPSTLSREDTAWLFSKVMLLLMLSYGSILLVVGNAVGLGMLVGLETNQPAFGWVTVIVMYVVGLHTRQWVTDWAIKKLFSVDDVKNIDKKAEGE